MSTCRRTQLMQQLHIYHLPLPVGWHSFYCCLVAAVPLLIVLLPWSICVVTKFKMTWSGMQYVS